MKGKSLLSFNIHCQYCITYYKIYSFSIGFTLGSFIKGMKARENLIRPSLEEEEETSLTTESLPCLGEVEKIIGYSFNNKTLLQQAFTHPSYQEKCESYERLEFVGDSVLNLLITKQQFSMYPNLPPGLLSPLRSANVDTEKLARVAINHNLHKYLRHGNRRLSKQVSDYYKYFSIVGDYLCANIYIIVPNC